MKLGMPPAGLRWALLLALLTLAACVGTNVRNLTRGTAGGTVDALLIVYRPSTFGGTNTAGSLGSRNLAALVPHLAARLPAQLQMEGIRARMVSETQLAGVLRQPDEKLMWIAASSASYSTRTGQQLVLQAEVLEPGSQASLWRGEIVLSTLGFGSFDDSVADSIGRQIVAQLGQARMLPRQRPAGAPVAAAAPPAVLPPAALQAPRGLSGLPPGPPVVADAPPPAAPPRPARAPALPASAASPQHLASGFAATDDVDAIPYLNDRGRQGYRDWLRQPTPRAFAIAPNGSWFATSGLRPRDATLPIDPTERALAACERAARLPCKLYAVNGSVVWVK